MVFGAGRNRAEASTHRARQNELRRRRMTDKYDAIVIGTGQAGSPLAVRLGKAGRRTAIIERKLVGGTCVNNGCIPTKTLIASARAAHVARRGADFGVFLDAPIR